MELESYHKFLNEDKGTRVGRETVLEDCLGGSSPEEIAACRWNRSILRFPSINCSGQQDVTQLAFQPSFNICIGGRGLGCS
jgi:hypothetical protein